MHKKIAIYFNVNYGYIVTSIAKGESGIPTVKYPVYSVPLNSEPKDKMHVIQEALDFSCTNTSSIKTNNFWEVMGIKSFSSFSKKFTSIQLELINHEYKLTKLKVPDKRGGYVIDTDQNPIILSSNMTGKVLFEIERLLDIQSSYFPKVILKTLNDKEVSYNDMIDNYDDIGDGHTDAYQIYVHESYDKNYIGFMIDSGYDSFSSEDIQTKWKQYYGELNTFEYQEVSNAEYDTKVVATTNELEIQSYLFKDGEGTLELIFEIDLLTTPKEEQNKIRRDFISLVESVKLNEK